MSSTNYALNDPETVKVWARVAQHQALKATPIAPLIGKPGDKNAVIYQKDELKKGAGDRIRCTLYTTPDGDGFTEGETVEGNAESLTSYTDDLVINELGHAIGVAGEGTISQQRIPWSLRKEAMFQLGEWWSNRYSETFFNVVCGNTAQSNGKYTGLNAATAPSANRVIRANGASNDQSLSSSDTFTLDLIDYAKEMAETADVPVRPIMINGEKKYIVYLHNFQVTSLRTNTSAGQWREIQLAALQGGKHSRNPLYTSALGEYHDCILRKAFHVTKGVHSSTGAVVDDVRRAVLLGAQAATMGFGRKDQANKFRWHEELIDHARRLEVSAFANFGMKKSVFNSEDFGTVTIHTHAAKAQ